jgi:uncharacterized protein (TIGR03086 family)
MNAELVEAAVKTTRGVLEGVHPEQLGDPSPCRSWTIGEVISHMIETHRNFVAILAGGELASTSAPDAGPDFLAEYDDASAATIAAFRAPGALERTLRLPFGTVPGAVAAQLAATDTLIHGWDVARATGQPTDLAPTEAVELLENARQLLPDEVRGPEGQAPFGPECQAGPDATNADRLAAFLGRQP